MELRYCEECGDVIRLESDEPASLHEHFLCPKCKGEEPAASGRVEASRKLEEEFAAVDLDLFSSQSIALRKQGLESGVQKAPETRLRLVKTTETSGTSVAEPDDPVGQPFAPTRQETMLGATTGTATATGALATAAPPGASATGGKPAKSARKIIFRCLHCKSPLSIRPVEKTSKLVCPSCRQAVYVTPGGRLLKTNPSAADRGDDASDSGLQSVTASSLARPGAGLRTETTASPPSVAAQLVEPQAAAQLHTLDDLAETRERLSAFEEHVYSQDPNKTAFLTEESTPLSDLRDSDSEEFPLANEFLSSVVQPRSSVGDWPEGEEEEDEEEEDEEWPEESDLLAEDEFDDNRGSGSRKRTTRRPPAVRVMLVGTGLLLPFALAVALFVTHFSDPESRAFDPDPALTTLEKLGNAAKRGITALMNAGETPEDRWVPGN